MRRCPNGHPVFDDRRSACPCGAPLRPVAAPSQPVEDQAFGGQGPGSQGLGSEVPGSQAGQLGGTTELATLRPRHAEPLAETIAEPAAERSAAPSAGVHPDVDPGLHPHGDRNGSASVLSDLPADETVGIPPLDPDRTQFVPAPGGGRADTGDGDSPGYYDAGEDPDPTHATTAGTRTEPTRTRALDAPEVPADPDPSEAVDARSMRRERRPRRRRRGWLRWLLVILLLCGLAVAIGFALGRFGPLRTHRAATVPSSAPRASTPPSKAPSSPSRPLLQVGSSGPDVARLQRALTAAGFSPGAADGAFGGGTATQLRAFQASKGLPTTGTTDPATWAALPSAP